MKIRPKLLAFFRQPIIRSHLIDQLGAVRKHEYNRHSLEFIDSLESMVIKSSPAIDRLIRGSSNLTSDNRLISMFQQFMEQKSTSSTGSNQKASKKIRQLADLRNPVNWYQFARGNKRRIILHVGPTNSGKTFQALERFRQASSGIYCGPLRLLAHEIYERMNADHRLPCQLVTGEERRDAYQDSMPESDLTGSNTQTSRHTAATVEMADFGKFYDVAIIDEIQMLGDRDRGWAFTHALLFLPCNELHLCGDPSVVPVIQRLARSTGEQVTVNRYERLRPLRVAESPLSSLSKIQPGDCVVTFSRKSVFRLKQQIEQSTGLRCAVVYGSLPPETRSEQARLFNQEGSGFDVMVASDAVGMGLNLNINRVVFNSVDKFDGQRVVQLSAGQIKQIAGRAGRYNSKIIADDIQQDPGGTVTAMSSADLEIIRQCVEMPADRLQPVNRVGLQPTADIINEFASYYPQLPLATLLDKFQEMARVDGDYFLCQLDDAKGLADQLQPIDMPIEERFQFTMAPVRLQDQLEVECIQALAGARDRRLEGERKRNANRARRGYSVLDIPLIKRSLVGGSPRSASELTAVYRQCLNASELHGLMAVEEEMEPVVRLLKQAWQPAQTHYGLTQYERLHRVVTLYNWLHYRFPETYQSATMAGLIKRFLEQLIDESLFKMHSVSRFSADTNPSINIDQLLLSKLKF